MKINGIILMIVGVVIFLSSLWVGLYFISKYPEFYPSFPIIVTMNIGIIAGLNTFLSGFNNG
jgi:hypothetical protein